MPQLRFWPRDINQEQKNYSFICTGTLATHRYRKNIWICNYLPFQGSSHNKKKTPQNQTNPRPPTLPPSSFNHMNKTLITKANWGNKVKLLWRGKNKNVAGSFSQSKVIHQVTGLMQFHLELQNALSAVTEASCAAKLSGSTAHPPFEQCCLPRWTSCCCPACPSKWSLTDRRAWAECRTGWRTCATPRCRLWVELYHPGDSALSAGAGSRGGNL